MAAPFYHFFSVNTPIRAMAKIEEKKHEKHTKLALNLMTVYQM